MATVQSRSTVAGETSRAWAVSSMLRPVKNLSSTTRQRRGSRACSSLSASSRARISMVGISAPPPRCAASPPSRRRLACGRPSGAHGRRVSAALIARPSRRDACGSAAWRGRQPAADMPRGRARSAPGVPPFAAKPRAHAAQLAVDEREQPLEGLGVPLLPCFDQFRDVLARLRLGHIGPRGPVLF